MAINALTSLLTISATTSFDAPFVPTCKSDEGCYGGKCQVDGTCLCPPLWKGPHCQVLRLKPANPAAPGLLLPNTSTWGGNAVEGNDGKWHMFAAKMKNNCGLRSWHTTIQGVNVANSEIVHAVASSPIGPYKEVETVLETFSHGPQVSIFPDGRLVLVNLGCGNQTLPEVSDCINGSTPGFGQSSIVSPFSRYNRTYGYVGERESRPPGLSNCDWPGWTGVLATSNKNNKFSTWNQLADWEGSGLVVQGGPDSWHNSDLNGSVHADNPSFWPLQNGSVLLAYATKLKHPSNHKATGHKHIGLAIGELPLDDSPLQPFRDIVSQPVFPFEAEDPTIFLDSTNNLGDMRWHIMAHRLVSNISTAVCAHAVAASPFGPWKVATIPAYTAKIAWSNNGNITFSSSGRERPHMIIDRAGRPVALSTGVSPGRWPTPVTPSGYVGDFSYTHVQLVDPAY